MSDDKDDEKKDVNNIPYAKRLENGKPVNDNVTSILDKQNDLSQNGLSQGGLKPKRERNIEHEKLGYKLLTNILKTVVILFLLTWGTPDMLDAIIHRIGGY